MIYGKTHTDMMPLLSMYAGMGAVLGHNYPFYLKFKGGKGIAATAGLIISTTNIWIVLICLAAFIAIVATTRYVSLGFYDGCYDLSDQCDCIWSTRRISMWKM